MIEPGKFSEDWPTALRKELVESKKCAVDAVNGMRPDRPLTFKSGETLKISGWIFSKSDDIPADLYIQLVGPALTYTALAQNRIARPDVNAIFNLNKKLKPGFSMVAVQNAAIGEYKIELYQVGERNISVCRTPIAVIIN